LEKDFDPLKLSHLNVLSPYTSSFGLSVRIPHLEGEEMFRSTKHKADIPLGLKAKYTLT
jgi:hypothetical protein